MNVTTLEKAQSQGSEIEHPEQTRILIHVDEGSVQAVGCSDLSAQVIIVDWDANGCDPSDPTLVQLTHMFNPILVRVVSVEACPFDLFQGTEVEEAIGQQRFRSLCAPPSAHHGSSLRIVISMDATLQNVTCSDPDAEAIIVDRDVIGSDLLDEALAEWLRDGDLLRARVYRQPVFSLSQLIGSDMEQAIKAAGTANSFFADVASRHSPFITAFPRIP